MKVVEKDGMKSLLLETEEEKIAVIKGSLQIQANAGLATILTLRNKDLDTIKIVQAIANELIIISEHDVECKNCHDSLKHFLEQEVDKRFLGDDDLETIYFIFEFCLLSIDCSNKVVDTLCVDSNYYMQSFVLATIGDGVYDGTEQVLKFYDENHPDDDDDNFDDDDNGSDDGDSVEVAQECLAVST